MHGQQNIKKIKMSFKGVCMPLLRTSKIPKQKCIILNIVKSWEKLCKKLRS